MAYKSKNKKHRVSLNVCHWVIRNKGSKHEI